MLNVVLIIHLILALCLIGVVLLQRSEGGALGIGGGGGGLVSQRGATTALAKITWALATCFLCTSLLLTLLAQGGGTGSVLERFQQEGGGQVPLPDLSQSLPAEGDLVPPAPADNVPPAPAPAPAPAASGGTGSSGQDGSTSQ